MLGRLISLLIGYGFGCFLTAEAVAHYFAGRSAARLGRTGNPGMANIMATLGFLPGIVTLLGDLVKCLVGMTIAYLLFRKTGWIVVLYAGLGCTLGHDFPFWRRFRGGKGVAASSATFLIYSFLWGLLANLAGLLVVLATGYLCLAGLVVPFFFTLFMFCTGQTEAGMLGVVFTLLAFYCHGFDILSIREGKVPRIDLLGAIVNRFRRR